MIFFIRLTDIPENYGNAFENNDVFIFCGSGEFLNFHRICDVEIYFYIEYFYLDDQMLVFIRLQNEYKSKMCWNFYRFSFRFGVLHMNKKRMMFFHTTSYDSDYIYNLTHLFILPFLRSIIGKKQRISAIKTKVGNYLLCIK